MRRQRARITIPDLLFVLFAIAVLGALWPVWNNLFESNIGEIPTGTAWLLQLILPMALLVLVTVIFAKAARGVP